MNSPPSQAVSGYQHPAKGEYFRSRRVRPEDVQQPWLNKKHPRQIWVTVFPLAGLALGLVVTGILIWDGLRTVAQHKYCEIMNDNFTSWNDSLWTKEVELGGFG